MLPQQVPPPQSPRRIGVGIDTSRYGHYAVFRKDDLQPAADELAFAESAADYALLQQRLQGLVARYRPVAFAVRLDVAGPYADNLLHFLHQRATPHADDANSAPPLPLSISCGDPQRNKNYRAAFFGSHKSDPVEARAAARFALSEKPRGDKSLSLELRILRQVAGRLQAVVRQRTRLLNQFHHLLALTFPELALLTKDLAAGWVLERIHRSPSAARLAQATPDALATIAYLPDAQRTPLLEQAHHSVASLTGEAVDELVRDHVLVRRYLWMAALSAIRFNPAVRALYTRVVAKHPQRKALAVGHAMRKLLHRVFALCKSGRPFDPHHYPWQTPAHVEQSDKDMSVESQTSDNDMFVKSQAAGHKPEAEPTASGGTAACADSVAEGATVGESTWVDFAQVKEQLSLTQVLDQLGLLTKLRGRGPQRRGPCPLHRGDGRGRSFSVNLEANVFQCFDKQCGHKGDVIDLWAARHGLSLREAALDLVRTFGLEASSQPATEKRNG